MAKKRKKRAPSKAALAKAERESARGRQPGFWGRLREETRNSIIGILLIIIAVILLVSAFGPSGHLGGGIYGVVHFLFGVGYYLIPVLFLVLGVNFFRAGGHNFTTPALVAGPFFIISSLGLLALASHTDAGIDGYGGFIGYYIMTPMVYLFASLLTTIILGAILLIAVLILFDTPLHMGFMMSFLNIFKRNPKEVADEEYEDEDVEEEEVVEETIEETEDEDEPVETVVPEEPERESLPEEKAPIFAKTVTNTAPKKSPDDAPFRFNTSLHAAYTPPPLSLLAGDRGKPGSGDIKANENVIRRTLQNFGIPVEMDEVSVGPSITRYALKPAEGVRLNKITTLQHDLELALAAAPIRIEAPIPGKSLVGIEMPNSVKSTVGLGSLLSEEEWKRNPNPLYVPLGKGTAGVAQFMNIAKMPHVLVAGATGSGKSVTMHTIITALLYRNSPEQLRFIMVDPKRVELTMYNGIPHLLTPVITEAKKSILTLKWAAKEMDRRYDVLQEEKCRDIGSYHKNVLQPALAKYEKDKAAGKIGEGEDPLLPELMPYIVIIIDELADLMSAYPRELEASIVRLAQMSRAVGIHLMIATQRPSVNVITGLIKANVPARIALQVASQIDSRTILDQSGAENLLGAGDMLFLSAELPKPIRLQSAFISESEVKSVVKFLKDHYDGTLGDELNLSNAENKNQFFGGIPDDVLSGAGDGDDDDRYEEAKELVITSGKASTSFLQRRLSLGYARAARMMDVLEERGVVGPADGAKPRDVLMKGDGSSAGFGTESE